jgi:hypothetical protein
VRGGTHFLIRGMARTRGTPARRAAASTSLRVDVDPSDQCDKAHTHSEKQPSPTPPPRCSFCADERPAIAVEVRTVYRTWHPRCSRDAARFSPPAVAQRGGLQHTWRADRKDDQLSVGPELRSCHTGYTFVQAHVPISHGSPRPVGFCHHRSIPFGIRWLQEYTGASNPWAEGQVVGTGRAVG